MTNKSIVWMLAVLGLVGCTKDSKVVEVGPDTNKTVKADTALVLRAWPASFRQSAKFLVVNRAGELFELTHHYGIDGKSMYRFSDAGDTVIVKNSRIIENLTMKNKINAFSRQK